MGYYDMVDNGDWPYFKELADQYAINDNYHQPVMGELAPTQFMDDRRCLLPGIKMAIPPSRV